MWFSQCLGMYYQLPRSCFILEHLESPSSRRKRLAHAHDHPQGLAYPAAQLPHHVDTPTAQHQPEQFSSILSLLSSTSTPNHVYLVVPSVLLQTSILYTRPLRHHACQYAKISSVGSIFQARLAILTLDISRPLFRHGFDSSKICRQGSCRARACSDHLKPSLPLQSRARSPRRIHTTAEN